MASVEFGTDYKNREYLSVVEVSSLTGWSVEEIHRKVRSDEIPAHRSGSGQYRFKLDDVRGFSVKACASQQARVVRLKVKSTDQTIITGNSRKMGEIADDSIHMVVTSPPYFNAKMYSDQEADLGNVHDLEVWLREIGAVWREVHRVLSPGRKFFLNIMNLPIRVKNTFRLLNLVGKSVDLCEEIGFVFKRDIVWQKTNGVRAHFGTYPYPGGILINNMHESILEFEKVAPPGFRKYAHVTAEQKSQSKLDKDFWLSLKNTDVWTMKPEKSGGSRKHASPFPVELPERLIRAYTYVGETVLDPFLGSGTALVAASTWGRNGVGYEINPEFSKMSAARLEDFSWELL